MADTPIPDEEIGQPIPSHIYTMAEAINKAHMNVFAQLGLNPPVEEESAEPIPTDIYDKVKHATDLTAAAVAGVSSSALRGEIKEDTGTNVGGTELSDWEIENPRIAGIVKAARTAIPATAAAIGGGIATGVTLGAFNPFEGTVGLPFGIGDRYRYPAKTLGEMVSGVAGDTEGAVDVGGTKIQPWERENPVGAGLTNVLRTGAEIKGISGPWKAISGGVTKGVEKAARVISPGGKGLAPVAEKIFETGSRVIPASQHIIDAATKIGIQTITGGIVGGAMGGLPSIFEGMAIGAVAGGAGEALIGAAKAIKAGPLRDLSNSLTDLLYKENRDSGLTPQQARNAADAITERVRGLSVRDIKVATKRAKARATTKPYREEPVEEPPTTAAENQVNIINEINVAKKEAAAKEAAEAKAKAAPVSKVEKPIKVAPSPEAPEVTSIGVKPLEVTTEGATIPSATPSAKVIELFPGKEPPKFAAGNKVVATAPIVDGEEVLGVNDKAFELAKMLIGEKEPRGKRLQDTLMSTRLMVTDVAQFNDAYNQLATQYKNKGIAITYALEVMDKRGLLKEATSTEGVKMTPVTSEPTLLRPEPIEEVSSKAPVRPTEEWEADVGAMPGEPILIHKNGAIVERVNEKNKVLYEAVNNEGQSLGMSPKLDDARKLVESATSLESAVSETPVADLLTGKTVPTVGGETDAKSVRVTEERVPRRRIASKASKDQGSKDLQQQPVEGSEGLPEAAPKQARKKVTEVEEELIALQDEKLEPPEPTDEELKALEKEIDAEVQSAGSLHAWFDSDNDFAAIIEELKKEEAVWEDETERHSRAVEERKSSKSRRLARVEKKIAEAEKQHVIMTPLVEDTLVDVRTPSEKVQGHSLYKTDEQLANIKEDIEKKLATSVPLSDIDAIDYISAEASLAFRQEGFGLQDVIDAIEARGLNAPKLFDFLDVIRDALEAGSSPDSNLMMRSTLKGIEESSIGATEAKLDFNREQVLEIMKRDMLNQRPEDTIVNELLQNSIDAYPPEVVPNITVALLDSGMIFGDDGIGMSPEELREAYLKIGNIGTKTEASRGGYGFAKVPILLYPDKITVISKQDGKPAYVFTASREELMKGSPIAIVPFEGTTIAEDIRGGEKILDTHGTIIQLEIGNFSYYKRVAVKGRLEYYGSNLRTKTVIGIGSDPVIETSSWESTQSMYPSHKVTVKDSDVEVKYVPCEQYGGRCWGGYQISTIVLNKGLPIQARMAEPQLRWKPNFRIEVNFLKTPLTADINYPFIKNRSEVVYAISDEISEGYIKFIKDINKEYDKQLRNSFLNSINNARVINGVRVINPFEKHKVDIDEVVDANPQVIAGLAKLYDHFNKILQGVGIEGVEVAMTLDPTLCGFRPKASLGLPGFIAYSPVGINKELMKSKFIQAAIAAGQDITKMKAANAAFTFVHEYAHIKEENHQESFTSEVERLNMVIGYNALAKLQEEAYELFSDPNFKGGLQQIEDAVLLYAEDEPILQALSASQVGNGSFLYTVRENVPPADAGDSGPDRGRGAGSTELSSNPFIRPLAEFLSRISFTRTAINKGRVSIWKESLPDNLEAPVGKTKEAIYEEGEQKIRVEKMPEDELYLRTVFGHSYNSVKNNPMAIRIARMIIQAEKLSAFNSEQGAIFLEGQQKILTEAEQRAMTKLGHKLMDYARHLRKDINSMGTYPEAGIADMVNEGVINMLSTSPVSQAVKQVYKALREDYLEPMKHKIRDYLYAELKGGLEFGDACEDVVRKMNLGKPFPIAAVLNKYNISSTKDIGKFMTELKEYFKQTNEINNWGEEHYWTHFMRGNIKVIADGRVISVAMDSDIAIEQARRYLEEHPDVKNIDITSGFYGGDDFVTMVGRRRYFAIRGKVRKLIQEVEKGLTDVQADLKARGIISGAFGIKPSMPFAASMKKSKHILPGEENIFDALAIYNRAINKYIAYGEALNMMKKYGDSLPPNIRRNLESSLKWSKGALSPLDKIVDEVVNKTTFGLLEPSGSWSKGLGKARGTVAASKLGYRMVSAVYNNLSGYMNPWAEYGTRQLLRGVYLARSEKGKQLLTKYAYQLGKGVLDDGSHISVARKTFLGHIKGAKTMLLPTGMFQVGEPYIRATTWCTAYDWISHIEPTLGEAEWADWAELAVNELQGGNTIAEAPMLLRSPEGRTIGLFKRFLIREVERISRNRHNIPFWGRYLGFIMAVAGPRGILWMIKSLPILATIYEVTGDSGFLEKLEAWLMAKYPKGAHGLPGILFGQTATGPATIQFPLSFGDFAAAGAMDAINLAKLVKSAIKGEPNLAKKADETARRMAPTARGILESIESAKKDGWVQDEYGSKMFTLDSTWDRVWNILGWRSVDREFDSQVHRVRVQLIREQRKLEQAMIGEVSNLIPQKGAVERISYLMESRIQEMIDRGVDPKKVLERAKWNQIPVNFRDDMRTRTLTELENILMKEEYRRQNTSPGLEDLR